MLILISPAKKLNLETNQAANLTTRPIFEKKTTDLIGKLKKLTPLEIKNLMKLSDSLAEINYQRFQSFSKKDNLHPAVYMFAGDTYTGLDINSFTATQVKSSQKRLRILSGLYGLLKPLDQIRPYRLEMGSKLQIKSKKNLYQFWKEDLTNALEQELKNHEALVNLASNEYFSAVDTSKISGPIVCPVFKEKKNGIYKIISFNAKKARGQMAQYLIKNNITMVEDIKKFDLDNYKYNSKLSTENTPVFTRG